MDQLIERLSYLCELHSGLLQHDKGRATQTEQDHVMISRQDSAYQESLEKDNERKRKQEEERRREREGAERKEREEKEKQEREKQEKISKEKEEEERKKKLEKKKKLLEQKKSQMPEEPSEKEECCHVLIKLSSGERIKRRFLFTDSLQLVFDFVDFHIDASIDPEDYQLVTQFPRLVYTRSAESLSKVGFTSRMSLIYEEV